MKTYLVPVDFSKASTHAAEFAAALSHQTNVEHILLVNAYYVSIYETTLPSPDMVMISAEEIEENSAERIKKLESLQRELYKKVREGVKITTHLNHSHLVRAVVENAEMHKADLVIMGSVGNSSHNDARIGSHVIKVSKVSPVPVMVIPPDYTFENIDRIVIACDFNKVKESIPMHQLKKLLSREKLELLVVNVDSNGKHNSSDAERLAEETALYGMLKQYKPQYYYVNHKNIINGILQFAEEHDAQLVIVLPHKYSFFQDLLHNSVSIQLATSSVVPVLLLK